MPKSSTAATRRQAATVSRPRRSTPSVYRSPPPESAQLQYEVSPLASIQSELTTLRNEIALLRNRPHSSHAPTLEQPTTSHTYTPEPAQTHPQITPEDAAEILLDPPTASFPVNNTFNPASGGTSDTRTPLPPHLRPSKVPPSAMPILLMSSASYSQPSEAIPLGSSMEPRLKERIIRGLYVPINIVIMAEQGDDIEYYLKNLSFNLGNESRSRSYTPPINIDKWTDGFLTYMSIWISATPGDALPMLHYMHLVRAMSRNTPGPVWLHYDREFRIRRQNDTSLPWDSIHPQLYFQLITRHSPLARPDLLFSQTRNWQTQPLTAASARSPVTTAEARHIFRKGYCTHYNIHGSCRRPTKCSALAHRCSICDATNHPALQCKQYNPPKGHPTPTTSESPKAATKATR